MTTHYSLAGHPQSAHHIDFANDLNAQQIAAVQAKPGANLVIAGAGSGKTRTLTYRVAWLLAQGVMPQNILLLTFTNKAAHEMLARVRTLIPVGSEGIWGGTFHSIGNRLLRLHGENIGFPPGFSILDREDQKNMIEAVVVKEGLRTPDKRFPKAEVLSEIFGLATNTLKPLPVLLTQRYPYFLGMAEQIAHVFTAFAVRKRATHSLDFDDLLSKALELLESHEEIAKFYREKFHHILVDEYQDTNRLQSEFVERLASHHGNIMIVGDDAQSIYSWRGADFENILSFPKRHRGTSLFRIETNYRSVPEILDVSNAVIHANKRQFEKTLTAMRPPAGKKPAWVPLATNTEQASFVAQRVLELHEDGVPLNEIAVLYRAHYHSLEVQLEFTRRGIPFSITSGIRFFEQAHIKDIAAFIRFSVNPRDEISFKRIVRILPGIGAKSADSLWTQIAANPGDKKDFDYSSLKISTKARKSWSQLTHTFRELGKTISPASMIESVLSTLYDDYLKERFANYEARYEDIQTLAAFAREFQNAEEFLSQLALLSAVETADKIVLPGENERVTLSSVHQAKGLEWKIVFLIWLADGMFPSSRSLDDPQALEEERRLFYVGLTRCKDELYLSYPEIRLGGYGEAFQLPSRFLQDIPQTKLERWKVDYLPSEEAPF
ncbi:MAG: DNA helicase UvrD [Verrucomicrobia bacterium]|nr:MAG: DNA helicase UvrD [Verrucomicrobiota bacterium]